MKTFIAYALVIIGIPNFGGLLVCFIIGMPLSQIFPMPLRLRVLPYFEFFGGLGAAIFAAFLFKLFELAPTVAVPIIMAVWMVLYFTSHHQQHVGLVCWLVGLLVGWLAIPHMLGV